MQLRSSGFANIVGLKPFDMVNNSIMISRKGSSLMSLFNREQQVNFNGEWTAHSVALLTRLARRLSAIPNEMC